MRLLNIGTFGFEEFFNEENVPKYATLSHTWGNAEVTFQDLSGPLGLAKTKEGFQKILFCRNQALIDGLMHVWIDTCCIDKTSSAELTEAINSMYRWYNEAEVCYVYLADVSNPPSTLFITESEECQNFWDIFAKSRWFTRGWTLQELIAPSKLSFYSREWQTIGQEISVNNKLVEKVSTITGIRVEVLQGYPPGKICVAERMCWAARRKATRPEDMAYSLMGIFDVNMPIIYGEGGRKAFIRLQEEILKNSDDHTIFAWRNPVASFFSFSGLLAPSPAFFGGEYGFERCGFRKEIEQSYNMTNKGLRISLHMKSIKSFGETEHIVFLNCLQRIPSGQTTGVVGLRLKNMGSKSAPTAQHMRVMASDLYVEDIKQVVRHPITELYIPREVYVPKDYRTCRVAGFYIRNMRNLSHYSTAFWPPGAWDPTDSVLKLREPTKYIQSRVLCSRDIWLAAGHQQCQRTVVCLEFNGTQTFMASKYSRGTLESLEYFGTIYIVPDDYRIENEPRGMTEAPKMRLKLFDIALMKDELVIPIEIVSFD